MSTDQQPTKSDAEAFREAMGMGSLLEKFLTGQVAKDQLLDASIDDFKTQLDEMPLPAIASVPLLASIQRSKGSSAGQAFLAVAEVSSCAADVLLMAGVHFLCKYLDERRKRENAAAPPAATNQGGGSASPASGL